MYYSIIMKLTPFIKQFVAVTGIVLFALIFIRVFNIAYPVKVINTSTASELSVVGEGEVEVIPDIAQVTVGVNVARAATVEDAQQQMSKVNNSIIAAMQKLGVDKKDIKTANYAVYPEYSYEGARSIVGYNGDVQITIKTKKIDMVSQMVEAATAAGANNIQGTSFTVSDTNKYREEARNKAIENAREQAHKISKTLGIKLGRVTNMVESSPDSVYPVYKSANAFAEGLGGASPNFEAGTQKINSVVTLYFEKQDGFLPF